VVLEGIQDTMGSQSIRVFEPIGRYTSIARASLEGRPSIVLEPESPGSWAYRNLAKKIAHELELARAAS
ncbi:MAG: hypothetical protein ICV68_15030, partial [Pyrinomonadaceae bacterium]|nr:hypothetical protein [Pyrinomonadaceae bacterium]